MSGSALQAGMLNPPKGKPLNISDTGPAQPGRFQKVPLIPSLHRASWGHQVLLTGPVITATAFPKWDTHAAAPLTNTARDQSSPKALGSLVVAEVKVTPTAPFPLTPWNGLSPRHPGVVGGRLEILAFPRVVIWASQMILRKDETSFPHVTSLPCLRVFTRQGQVPPAYGFSHVHWKAKGLWDKVIEPCRASR
eukprot:218743-Amphidinium_carterae.1